MPTVERRSVREIARDMPEITTEEFEDIFAHEDWSFDRDYASFPNRAWTHSKHLVTEPKPGEIVKSARKFGIEIEADYGCKTGRVEAAKDKINQHIGITQDSGAEFQTPPACGKKAELLITTLITVLKKYKFMCGISQGLHVHIGGEDLLEGNDGWKGLQGLWAFYIIFDDVIRSLIAPHRRKSRWCLPTEDHLKEVLACNSMSDLETVWYRGNPPIAIKQIKSLGKGGWERRGFNLHSLIAMGHLEIRYHEGILDARTILEWANLHCLIMDKAKAGISAEWLIEASKRHWGRRKFMADFLGLPKESRVHFTKRALKCVG